MSYDGHVGQVDVSASAVLDVVPNDVDFQGAVTFSGGTSGGPATSQQITGAAQTVTPSAQSGCLIIDATTNDAFTVNAPTGTAGPGQRLTVIIANTSGGAMGAVTFAAAYFQPAAYTEPANGARNVITLVFDGTAWNFASVSADLT